MSAKNLLVLDLHGTLISPTGYKFRPHLAHFFEVCKECRFDLAIWSGGSEDEVKRVSKMLTEAFSCSFEFTWCIKQCMLRDFWKPCKIPRLTKPLSLVESKLGRKWNTIHILDDTAEKAWFNKKQLISLPTWNGNKNDDALIQVVKQIRIIT